MGKHHDWTEVRREYEQGESLTRLAKKYGISIDTVKKASARQKWVKGNAKVARMEKRAEEMAPNGTEENSTGETAQTSPNPSSADINDRIVRVAVRLMDGIEAVLDMEDGKAGSKTLRELSGSLKDLRSIVSAKDELDREEQKARIEKLKAEARIGDAGGDREFKVRFVGLDGAEQ